MSHLDPSIIQRVSGQRWPSTAITAPWPHAVINTALSERERLAQFEYSENFHRIREQERRNGEAN